ncbi:uncharacterized protein [Macrobrachium rosenbergii]
MERCTSNTSTFSFSQDICRICHCEGDAESPLIAPCYCAGSLRYVHQSCLQQWIKSSDTKSCELCKFNFIMHSKIKPFNKWEKLDMSGMERRKIACSVTFHVVALTCVVWALYILIERTTEEVQEGSLEWPFWTKLIVVAIGFTGGLVFMYVQCKMYVQLCKRWRAFNRVIYVQNVPEKVPLSERDRADLQREPAQPCGGGGGGGKDNCGESHESEKSLMGVSTITGSATHDLPRPHPTHPPPSLLPSPITPLLLPLLLLPPLLPLLPQIPHLSSPTHHSPPSSPPQTPPPQPPPVPLVRSGTMSPHQSWLLPSLPLAQESCQAYDAQEPTRSSTSISRSPQHLPRRDQVTTPGRAVETGGRPSRRPSLTRGAATTAAWRSCRAKPSHKTRCSSNSSSSHSGNAAPTASVWRTAATGA